MTAGLDRQMRELKHERGESGLKTALCLLAFTVTTAGFNVALYSEGFFRSKSGDDMYCVDFENGKISLDLSGLCSLPFSLSNSVHVSTPGEGAATKSMELTPPSEAADCPLPDSPSPLLNETSDTGMLVTIGPEDGQPPASVFLPQFAAYDINNQRDEPAGQLSRAKTGVLAMPAD
jgi:hypothetical protein